MSTTTDLTTLKINYLTQAQYDTALSGGTINENEIYLTPQVDYATIASQYYFMGRVSSSTSTTANTGVRLAWSITRQNPSGSWTRSDSNRELVCPAAGYYEISSMIYWNPSTSGTYSVRTQMFVNGTGDSVSTANTVSAGGVAVSVVNGPIILNLSQNDTINLYITTSGAGTVSSGDALSRIVIRRIT